MRGNLLGAIVIVLAALLSLDAGAVLPDEVLPNPVLEARARAISKELRCVVCQNQSIDDSSAPLARDMRILVRERLVAGDSDSQVKAYLVERYGNFVLLRPPVQADTLLLWLGPAIFLLTAFGGFAFYLRKSKNQLTITAPPPLSDEEDALLKRAIEDQA
ncbi:MAG: cytochrome c-type biogenesis protein CcmH [Alphaproteobacteria bacterium]|nr:cytochrome c-type biogenesis protein CcmH [Alphaproteobacteria bacterium]